MLYSLTAGTTPYLYGLTGPFDLLRLKHMLGVPTCRVLHSLLSLSLSNHRTHDDPPCPSAPQSVVFATGDYLVSVPRCTIPSGTTFEGELMVVRNPNVEPHKPWAERRNEVKGDTARSCRLHKPTFPRCQSRFKTLCVTSDRRVRGRRCPNCTPTPPKLASRSGTTSDPRSRKP